jgi:tetratricopeptide (TPR) repeat protein
MAQKKRRFQQLQAAAATAEPRDNRVYTNPVQKQVSEKLDNIGKNFEGKGRTILYAIGALIVIVILVMVFMNWNRRSGGAGQAALGKAIETSQARISDTGTPAGSTAKTFKTEKERGEAAIAEFQAAADKFGGAVAEKAKYFIAVTKLDVDRPAAITELEGLAKRTDEVGKMAKFALAQTRVADNKPDDALALFQELAKLDDALVAKDTINFEIAKIYEKQGKKAEAVEIYFNIAKAAAEAKDADGKAITPTQTATEAKEKVTELDPEKAKQIPEQAPVSPFGAG